MRLSRWRAWSHPSPPSSPGLLSEPLFHRALGLERKRAERSGRRFVLMLVEAAQAFTDDREGLRGTIVGALLSPIRETDVAGWYRAHRVAAVIFTELGAAETQAAVAALRGRVTTALQSQLRPEWLAHVHVSFHCFPDDGAAGELAPALYPDVVGRDQARRLARAIKRGIDVAGSALALMCLGPLLFAVAVAVRLSSPGPIFYRQQRIGRYGRPFTLFKFRSMQAFCDSGPHEEFVKRFIAGSSDQGTVGTNGPPVFKLIEDPRVTRVGRFLRRTSLDELPQLLNVLRGDMSLVGPRPPIPYELAAYGAWHRRRLIEVKPGITGLWQVNGRSRVSFDNMVRLDLRYARHWSMGLDLRILLRTPRAIFFGDGAY